MKNNIIISLQVTYSILTYSLKYIEDKQASVDFMNLLLRIYRLNNDFFHEATKSALFQ